MWKEINTWIEESEMSRWRKIFYVASRIGFTLLILVTFLVLARKIDIKWEEWSLYANTKGPKTLFNCGFLTLIILMWELGTEGETIRTILNIKEEDSWQKIAIAAGFYGVIILAYCYCIAGGT
jgi:hypothetical protein